jgi:hypothetical protein
VNDNEVPSLPTRQKHVALTDEVVDGFIGCLAVKINRPVSAVSAHDFYSLSN